ncbi:MAG: cytochrome C, partial [Citromicrobium sp.]
MLIAAVGLAAAILILWRGSAATEAAVQDQAVIALGQRLYAENCASCHGADLEGQPDWQTPLENGRYPAPPHDETGHTWHHADPLLERIIRDGTAAVVGDGYESDMPGFGDVMSD